MRTRIGIPRSLFYYKFFPLWKAFFQELGAEVVVSEPTNRRILDDGVKSCVDEACLPVKLFHGHVLNLKDKVDYLYIPRFTSISKREYICPEFGGLPDMIRHTLKGLPPLIDTEINMRRTGKGAIRSAEETASFLGIGKRSARRALFSALEDYWDFRYETLCGVVPFSDSGVSSGKKPVLPPNRELPGEGLKIALIGHPYNLYDRHISMDLLGKLHRQGAAIRTVEMVGEEEIRKYSSKLQKPMFWNYGRNAYGAALHLAADGKIDGMICVTSFGCGIDSFVNDLIERKVRKEYGIPLIIMTLDEHSGEAGFNTRLEAFIDMLYWRRTNENDVSASG